MTVIVAYRKLKRLEILDLKIVLKAFLGFFLVQNLTQSDQNLSLNHTITSPKSNAKLTSIVEELKSKIDEIALAMIKKVEEQAKFFAQKLDSTRCFKELNTDIVRGLLEYEFRKLNTNIERAEQL